MEIVVPRASWSDVFSDDVENPLIPSGPRSKRLRKEPAAMHLPCPSFLSKQWGEVQRSLSFHLSPISHIKVYTTLFNPYSLLEQTDKTTTI
jgi:hypothetical protein